MRRSAWLGLAVLLAAAGCEKPPPDGVTRVMLGDEELAAAVTDPEMPLPDEAARSWATAPWSGHPWIAYPGRVVLDIDHDLGRVPQGVLVYLSFGEDGVDPGLAAGDLAQIREVTSERVVIWNNTNSAFFARVVVF